MIFVPSSSLAARLYRRYHRRHGLGIHLFSRADLKRLVPPRARLAASRHVAFSWVARIERTV